MEKEIVWWGRGDLDRGQLLTSTEENLTIPLFLLNFNPKPNPTKLLIFLLEVAIIG